jgi:hypothetical protein
LTPAKITFLAESRGEGRGEGKVRKEGTTQVGQRVDDEEGWRG